MNTLRETVPLHMHTTVLVVCHFCIINLLILTTVLLMCRFTSNRSLKLFNADEVDVAIEFLCTL